MKPDGRKYRAEDRRQIAGRRRISPERAHFGFHSADRDTFSRSAVLFTGMPVPIRFRTDSAFKADDTAARARGDKLLWHDSAELDADPVPPAEPGDCWRVRWSGTLEQQRRGEQGPIAGYELCCLKCKRVHAWCTSTNCATKKPFTFTGTDGKSYTYNRCDHEGVGSCWQWTGSPEAGDLTASPSLWSVVEKGGCGYHGFLQNGVLSDG